MHPSVSEGKFVRAVGLGLPMRPSLSSPLSQLVGLCVSVDEGTGASGSVDKRVLFAKGCTIQFCY